MSFNSKYTGEQVESILDNILTEDRVQELLSSNTFKAFIVEDITINGKLYNAGSLIEISSTELDIQTTSNNSIACLYAYPGALTWQDWLEGV
jgi:hypothetical protein